MRRQLQGALRALLRWEMAIRSSAFTAANVPASHASALLLGILIDARNQLSTRLVELGSRSAVDDARQLTTVRTHVGRRRAYSGSPLIEICVRACRSLGRAFGSAFREAQRLADLVSAHILYGPLRQLEKQLWVLNPSQNG
ncbi:MAG: hypothetical protein ABIZ04_07275 [Opitutus sp.]